MMCKSLYDIWVLADVAGRILKKYTKLTVDGSSRTSNFGFLIGSSGSPSTASPTKESSIRSSSYLYASPSVRSSEKSNSGQINISRNQGDSSNDGCRLLGTRVQKLNSNRIYTTPEHSPRNLNAILP